MEMFVLGAAHSGKSEWILTQLRTSVIGTGVIPGLEARIAELKALRHPDWTHIEGENLTEALSRALAEGSQQILIDSVNLWLANFLLESWGKYDAAQHEARILHEMVRLETLLDDARAKGIRLAIVSSEVGAGVTPPDELTRLFRKTLGQLNRRFAARAQTVVQLVAGLPVFLKKG